MLRSQARTVLSPLPTSSAASSEKRHRGPSFRSTA